MSAKQGGSFATLLLAVPLSAIPLMAIFGVPEFADVSASTHQPTGDIVREASTSFDGEPFTAIRDHWGSSEADRPSQTDPGSTRQEGRANPSSDESQPQARRPWAELNDRALQHTPSPRPMQTAAPEPPAAKAAETAPATLPTPTADGLTWRDAARRLEEVGITDYRLERGVTSDEFLFVCRFSPGGDSRIVQRFEAEATEPLLAVENVLAQVDDWLQHRYADSRRWLP